jgi:glycine betaine transporter
MKSFKHHIFWPTFGSLVLGLLISAVAPLHFKKVLGSLNVAILDAFTPVFSWVAFGALILCTWLFFSPLGKLKIGGEQAKPIVNRWQWFSIAVCTTTGAGILFWAMAEPIYHYHEPPKSLLLRAASPQSELFALRSLFHNWGFVPNSLYTLFAVLFAFVFYQMRLPFSLSSCLHPLIKPKPGGAITQFVDGVSLFALVSGMAASMGSGILILSGGWQHLTGQASGPWMWIVFGSLIVATFVASALSGLHRGIQTLSNWNVRFFAFLVMFVLVMGPASHFLPLGARAFAGYLPDIVPNTLLLDFATDDPWPRAWTVFYWANWLAWTPITAIFLARIGYGYTYRNFIFMNLVLPGIFCLAWVTLFGGTALQLETLGGMDLYHVLKQSGPEGVTFAVLGALPFAAYTIPALLITAFLAYVTAADSNTVAMAGICSHGIEPESPEPPQVVKLIWGICVGFLSVAALCASGLDGIRELSTLGGFPILFMEIIAGVNLVRISINPLRYDRTVVATPKGTEQTPNLVPEFIPGLAPGNDGVL